MKERIATHTILDFRLGILDWGSFAQPWFQSASVCELPRPLFQLVQVDGRNKLENAF
jgi:hypothetical protein